VLDFTIFVLLRTTFTIAQLKIQVFTEPAECFIVDSSLASHESGELAAIYTGPLRDLFQRALGGFSRPNGSTQLFTHGASWHRRTS
jgi:hypothetical protein